ncbi:translation elongation factor Ts [Candidatus Peregrinibacteria bacterium]|nr:translation elongation factor Ts [Candidatus Peregrinibacteria bacterium]
MITAQQVNALRQRTGVSMMVCKRALEEAQGDEEKAIEIMRKKGEAKAAEKKDRTMKEGIVMTKIQGEKAAIVKAICETDFVAKNEEFRAIAAHALDIALQKGAQAALEAQQAAIKNLFTKLGENMAIDVKVMEGEGISDYVHTNGKVGALVDLTKADAEKGRDVAMQVTAMNPKVVTPSDVKEEDIAKEREIWKAQLVAEKKPAEILERIMQGKEKKFREESALMKQSFIKNGDMTVEEYLGEIKVSQFMRMGI